MDISPIPAEWLPHYSYNDYQKWEGDWELLHGLPYAMSPSPLRKHQLVGGNFVTMVNNELSKMKPNADARFYTNVIGL